ncbi:hypothetical protein N7516_011401 [Penicillium verrucosum]|uniref:uncharacterized protein n=1 Tax=Penicillium verrucosum TaxID=60171 RepID=UPI0025453784|nr:uncharacterized protein N7516_011401 [Penicillium verrucosum]KAJ5920543.1 hypothetical protein N7516_011401 [Penicillium verrucosum]
MAISKLSMLLASASLVAGHGYVSSIVADGKKPPESVGWATTATDLGFEDGTEYQDPNIICHRDGVNAALSATVTAGSSIDIQWTTWPESHHGPLITYLASCNGDCSTVDKTTLKFFKIEEDGLIDGKNPPGTWAADHLIAAGGQWTVKIPSTIAAGNYVMRHEIIALHSASQSNGAQNYPQCFNLKVTGGGSDVPEGTLGEDLYTNTDPGILFNIYSTLTSYVIPGPALYV